MRAVRITEGVNAFKDFVISKSAKNPNAFFHVFSHSFVHLLWTGLVKLSPKNILLWHFRFLSLSIMGTYICICVRVSEMTNRWNRQQNYSEGKAWKKGQSKKYRLQSAAILILKFHDGVFLYNKKWIEIK